jgi:hypothetical protein
MRFLNKLMLYIPVLFMAVKMRFRDKLNKPRTVLFILIMVTVVNGLLLYRHLAPTPSVFSGDVATGDVRTPESVEAPALPQANEADYVPEVGDIQNGSVEIFASSNERLLRYNAITPEDVGVLQANYAALAAYSDWIEVLDPPRAYEDQYKLLSAAVGELYDAAGIAYRLASDPVSATRGDFQEYERHVDEATASLEWSNEFLSEDFETTERLRLPTRPI